MIILRVLTLILVASFSVMAQGGINFQPRTVLTNSLATGISTLPLEVVNDAAAFAYSVARKLTNSYTGALALVVRSSDSATNYIVSSGASNNIAAIITWAGSDSVYVTNLFDQTGNGRHLVNGNTNGCFLVVTNGVQVSKNGYTVMKRVSASSVLSFTVTISQSVTFLACVYSDTKNTADVFWTGNGSTRTAVKQGATTYRLNATSNLDIETLTLDQWDILRVKFRPIGIGPDEIAVDGGSFSTGEAGDTGMTAIQIGSTTVCADMMIDGLIGWPVDVDDTMLGACRDDIKTFFNIY